MRVEEILPPRGLYCCLQVSLFPPTCVFGVTGESKILGRRALIRGTVACFVGRPSTRCPWWGDLSSFLSIDHAPGQISSFPDS